MPDQDTTATGPGGPWPAQNRHDLLEAHELDRARSAGDDWLETPLEEQDWWISHRSE